jgi:probable HAF family extracellular repeat protein
MTVPLSARLVPLGWMVLGLCAAACDNAGTPVQPLPPEFSTAPGTEKVAIRDLDRNGFSFATALNNDGQIVGLSVTAYGEHAVLWDSTMHDLDPLGAPYSEALAVNSKGQATGFHSTPLPGDGAEQHAFFWDGVAMRDLGTLGGGTGSQGLAVNNTGQVAGCSTTSSGTEHVFFWDGTTLRDVAASSDCFFFRVSVNVAGQVAGTFRTPLNQDHAFVWHNGSLRDLGTLGGPLSSANAINDVGQVVGSSTTASGDQHAFLWDGAIHDLGTLGGTQSNAVAVNSKGQATGWSLTASGAQHAFFWDGATMRDLGTLGTWSFGKAVNSSGQVAGESLTSSGNRRVFFWDGTVMLDLGTPSGTLVNSEMAYGALTAEGQVAGDSYNGNFSQVHATVWKVSHRPKG